MAFTQGQLLRRAIFFGILALVLWWLAVTQ
jgi:hypothetical protein